MPPIAIVVDYQIVAGREAELDSLLREHARLTLEEEAGCLRFEVMRPIKREGTPLPGRLMLAELYADETALAIHETNPRMAPLRTAMAPLVASKTVTLAALDEG